MSYNKNKKRWQLARLASRFETMSPSKRKGSFSQEELLSLEEYYIEEYLEVLAMEVLQFAIQEYPFTVEFYLRQAQIYIDNEQEEQAMSVLDKTLSFASKNVFVHLLRAESLASLELYSDALEIIDKQKTLCEAQESLSYVYLYEACIFEMMDSHERMFYSLKASLHENPFNKDALNRVWWCVEATRRHAESIDFHKAIIKRNPYAAVAWFNLGQALTYFTHYEEAIEAYEYAFVINESFELAYQACAEVCFDTQKYQKALDCYEELLEHVMPDSIMYMNIGMCHQKLGNLPEAKTYFRQALALEESNDEALFYLGQCFALDNNWKKAICCYMSAIDYNNDNEEYFAALAKAYYHLGKYDRAAKYFEAAAEIAPETSDYWVLYAEFLTKIGRAENALEVLKEAEQIAVGTELTYSKAACLFLMGQRTIALPMLGEALEEDFDMHQSLFDWVPDLQKDREVQAIISAYQPY